MNTKSSISFFRTLIFGKAAILISFLFQVSLLRAQCTPARTTLGTLQVSTFATGITGAFGATSDANGNVYVTNNLSNGTVWKITPDGTVSTFVTGLKSPRGIAIDGNGNLYVSNSEIVSSSLIYYISKITPDGTVSTFATGFSTFIYGMTVDSKGNLYTTNYTANTVSKVDTAGNVSLYATGFNRPFGITVDKNGNLYVVNSNSNTVSKVDTSGNVSIFATVGSPSFHPFAITTDGSDNLYVTYQDGSVKFVTPSGIASTFSANGSGGYGYGITTDKNGIFYVAVNGSNIINKIAKSITACGSYTVGSILHTTSGYYEDTLVGASSTGCDSIVTLYLAIKPIKRDTVFVSACSSYTWAQTGTTYTQNGFYNKTYTGANGCDSIITLNLTINSNSRDTVTVTQCNNYTWTQTGITYTQGGFYYKTYTDTNGCDSIVTLNLTINNGSRDTVYVTECDSYTWTQTEVTYTQSGFYYKTYTGATANGCDSIIILHLTIKKHARSTFGTAQTSTFATDSSGMYGIVADANGNFYVTHRTSGTIRKITSIGTVSTFASGLHTPVGITIDSSGNLYVANSNDNSISKITPDGTVSSFASGTLFTSPWGITIDHSGNLYVTNYGSSIISKITPDGTASIFAWGSMYQTGITIDGNENLYVANYSSRIISKITPNGTVSNYPQIVPSQPMDITTDDNGNLYVTNAATNATVSKITLDGTVSPFASGFNVSYGITTAPNGSFYVTNLNGTISKIEVAINACDNYTWSQNGQTYTTGGIYTHTLAGAAANGCDSTITLNLSVRPVSRDTIHVTQCGRYTWPQTGINYTQSNFYNDTLAGAAVNGCDSIITLNLTIKPISRDTVYVTECGRYMWEQTGITYTASGNYADTLTAVNGCDSIITLNLTIKPISNSAVSVTVCGGYTWGQTGVTYTASGTYTDTLAGVAVNGCDSVIILNLTIKPVGHSTTNKTACESYVWTQTGVTYTTSGNYNDTLGAAVNGCDSIITLNLTIKPNYRDTSETITQCNSYTWWRNGQTYTASGFYDTTYIGVAAYGCNSTLVLNLTIKPISHDTVYVTECNSYTWVKTGITYTQSGFYNKTYTAAAVNGCDSIITLNLTIKSISRDTITQTACSSYTWAETGITYAQSGFYSKIYAGAAANGCDSIITLKLALQVSHDIIHITADNSYTWRGHTYTENGLYSDTLTSVITGCDSIKMLSLTVTNPTTYEIPVKFHVIHTGQPVGAPQNPSDSMLENALAYLNHVYAADGAIPRFADTTNGGVKMPFHFVLAKRTPDCQANAIERIDGSGLPGYAANGVDITGTNPSVQVNWNSLIALSYPSELNAHSYNYLDVWVVTEIIGDAGGVGALGEPILMIEHNQMGENSIVFPHEVGHCLGLIHTFGSNGATADTCSSNDTCSTQGDKVCDTEPYTTSDVNPSTFSSSTINSCTGSPFGYVQYNIMSYNFPDPNRFTIGQRDRMINTYSGWWWGLGVSPAIPIAPAAQHDTVTTIAFGYHWHGQTYSSSGIYRIIDQCDSFMLHLTVVSKPIVRDTIAVVQCGGSYTWTRNGKTYAQSNYYKDTVLTQDTAYIHVLHLTINPIARTTLGSSWQVSTVASNLDQPSGITADANGNLYVTSRFNATAGVVYKIDTNGNVSVFSIPFPSISIQQQWYYVGGIVTDGTGNFYVSQQSGSNVAKIDAAGNAEIFASFNYLQNGDITIDNNGDLYVADIASHPCIKKIDESGNIIGCSPNVEFAGGAVTIDNNGNIYATTSTYYGDGTVVRKITPDGTVSTFASGVGFVGGITTDNYGSVYITDLTSGNVKKIDNSGMVSTIASGLDRPKGIIRDNNGNLYVTSNTTAGQVYKLSQVADTFQACGSLMVGSVLHTQTGFYNDTLTSVVTGCDSIVTVNLLVKTISHDTVSITNCDQYTSPASITYTQSGSYSDTLTSVVTGCDSIVTLNLEIKPISRDTISPVPQCTSYTWAHNGQTYTQSGLYSDSLVGQAANGCDSIKVLKLTIYQGTQQPIYKTAYQSYVWHGTMYMTSGTYTYNYNDDLGCPSTNTLYLTISATPVSAEGQCE